MPPWVLFNTIQARRNIGVEGLFANSSSWKWAENEKTTDAIIC